MSRIPVHKSPRLLGYKSLIETGLTHHPANIPRIRGYALADMMEVDIGPRAPSIIGLRWRRGGAAWPACESSWEMTGLARR